MKVCCVFNIAAHYREPIYRLLDNELHCDFFIGDRTYTPMKLMKYTSLRGFQKTLTFLPLVPPVHWLRGELSLAFRQYDDFIVTGDPYCLSTWLLLVVAKLRRKKVFLWTHGWYGDERFPKTWIKKLFFRLSHGLLLYGDYARNLLLREGLKSEMLHCVYNSLDYDKQVGIRGKLRQTNVYATHFGNMAPTLIYVGRLQTVKRLDLLIQAMTILREKGESCNLVLVGKSADDVNLLSIVEDNGLSGAVWFYGPCYDEEVLAELFYNAAVCVSPGNVGLTALHALSYGTPVITHDNFVHQMPEFEAIQDGRTGAFFHEGDVKHLADVISAWISPVQLKQREEVRKAAYRVIDERYNPHYQLRIIESVL